MLLTTIYKYLINEWSDWSNCTVKCGGCGLRVRVRACYGTMKKCKTEEQKRCGFQRCNVPQRMTECYGRIVVPCNLMDQLNFTVPDSKIKYLPSALG
uniref:CCN TSP1 domain-containing protein n=1 Tax=Syphacia muris TaxID=451379 RepID=A0A0N5AT52_9BILA